MQVILGLVGLIISTTMYFLFPETSQPGARGIDAMKGTNETDSSGPFVFINPLQSLWLLCSPAILLPVSFRTITYRLVNTFTDDIKRVSL